MTKKSIYFAHPVNTYETPLEAAVEQLAELVLKSTIESPNKPHHQKAYEQWQKKTAEGRDVHSAMAYFFEVVQPQCGGCVALPFLDGKFGLGVAGEIVKDADDGKPTWIIEPTNEGITEADLDVFIKNPDNGLFIIRLFTNGELDQIRNEVAEHQARIRAAEEYEAAEIVLSHQETRLRTFFVYRGEKRPYAEAHFVSMPIPDGFYPSDDT